MARRAKVSVATASLVLNGKGKQIGGPTRARVLTIAQELGYRTRTLARAKARLAGQRSGEGSHVAFLFQHRGEDEGDGLINPYPYAYSLWEELEPIIHQHNHLLIPISVNHGRKETPDTIPGVLLSQDIDAAVVMGEVATRQICQFLRARELPTVIVDNKIGAPEFSYVCIDNLAGARAATEHLLAQGYPRVAVIAGDFRITDQQTRSDSRERLDGVILALTAAGHAWDERLLYQEPFIIPGGGQRGAATLLDRVGAPLGILCFNDWFAWQALRECQRRGLRVPQDVGIVGFDDIRSFTEIVTPTITSVRVPWQHLGRIAGRKLMEELDDPKQEQVMIVCPTQLVPRESSRLAGEIGLPRAAEQASHHSLSG